MDQENLRDSAYVIPNFNSMFCTDKESNTKVGTEFHNSQLMGWMKHMPTEKAKEAEDNDEEQHMMREALSSIAPGLPAVFTIATKPTAFAEISTAKFLAEHSKDPFCWQLQSTVETSGSDCSYNRDGFLILVTPIGGGIQKVIPRSLQARLYTRITISD